MGKYLIILLFFPSLSFGQGFAALGNGNPLDTARILNNYFLPMKAMRFPAYAPATGDTNFVSTITPGGRVYGYSLNSFLARIGSYVGVPTLQQVTDEGFFTNVIMEYPDEFNFFLDRQIPNTRYVKTLISQTSWDSVMSETVTELTESRSLKFDLFESSETKPRLNK